MKAIAAYRRTLAIDSEDVTAHFGLAQAYHDPAWGRSAAEAPADRTVDGRGPVDPDELINLARKIAEAAPRRAAEVRRDAALRLAGDVVRSWRARGRSTNRGSSPCTRSSRSSARRGIAETDRPCPRGTGPRAGGDPPPAARAAQARRDGRGPGFRGGPEEGPRGQPERPVDRDPLAASPRCTGDRSASGPRSPSARHAVPCPDDPLRHGEGTMRRTIRSDAPRPSWACRSCRWPLPVAVPRRRSRRSPRPGTRPAARRHRPGRSRASSSWTSPRRPASPSATSTARPARSCCPRPWARASPSSTTTATATRTCSSSTRPPGRATTSSRPPTQALYRNDGKGHFEDVTKAAGLDKTFYGQGVAVGDYDNDGDEDLYVTAVGGGHLFRNDGKGHFEDVTESVNARGPNGWLTGAAFLDIENDGDLDLFVASYITWSPEIDKVQGFQLTGTRPGVRAADARSAARSARCCATTAAASWISASPRACRCERPT